jgi:S-formylglutathione hydrolase FrmB
MSATSLPTVSRARPVRLRRIRSVSLATGAFVLAAGGLAQAAPTAPTAPVGNVSAAVASSGAKVVAETRIAPNVVDLTVQSPAVGTTKVRLLLPKDFASRPDLAFPTFYLYHGANEPKDYTSWTEFTDVATFFKDKNALVVLPSDGLAGYYTDPVGPANAGQPKWETFHTKELPQLLKRGYRSNGHNAAGGISIGGYGALIYAARHPGFLKAAASYSGLTDTQSLAGTLSITAARASAKLDPEVWGSRLSNAKVWEAHNPAVNVKRLRGTKLYISAGDGAPGPLDNTRVTDATQARIGEMFVGAENRTFVASLKKARVPVTAHLYSGGWHNWGYWEREYKLSWPLLSKAIGGPTNASGG